MVRCAWSGLGIFCVLFVFGVARPLVGQTIQEFPVGAGPWGITTGPDGALWITEQGEPAIGRLTSEGQLTQFRISPGALPLFITTGSDGALWFTEQGLDRIGRVTTAGDVTEYAVRSGATPHGIVAGPDGALWFTELTGNRIGRLTTQGQLTEYPISGYAPIAITVGPDGNLWFTEGPGNQIGRITTAGTITEFSTGISSGANPYGIAAGPDGALWFAESNSASIGRITTSGQVTEFSAGMTPGSDPTDITAGPDGALWFTERFTNQIGRITTGGGITEYSSGITPGAEPRGITTGPDGALWFAEVYGNGVGRLAPPQAAGCEPSPTALCLNADRFKVEATFRTGQGLAGQAQMVQLTSDTGYMWFFGASNVEAVVKVINGCGLGGHYWVFAGGLTNVRVMMTVTDTVTGDVRQYVNPQNTPFQPIQDTSAFATCSASAISDSSKGASRAVAEAARIAELVRDVPKVSAACAPGSTALCLNSGRFKIEATFRTAQGVTGQAQVVPLTSDTGYLWFFSPENVEAVVKVLDGCGTNHRYWLFAGGLTNVRVNLTATDTLTGQVRTYTNPLNQPFQPIEDTSAFGNCPSGAVAPYGVDSHTVALWHFEDSPGSAVADATGVNAGTASGSTIVSSLFGHGRNFRGDGDGDYVTVPDSPSLRGMAQLTIEAWIYPTNFLLPLYNGAETIVGRGDDSAPYDLYQMTFLRNGDVPNFNSFTVAMEILAAGKTSQAESLVQHPPDHWYYIVGTYDGDRARVYVNGVLEAVGDSSPGIVVNTTDPLFINNHTFFNRTEQSSGRIGGIFDEVRISNIARSANEIAAIYAALPH